MSNMSLLFISLGVVIIILVSLSGTFMSRVEHPRYEVKNKDENIEVRVYPPLLLAEVSTQGDREEGINEGFRVLAKFIFGENKAKKKIAMTTPVTQKSSVKIAMTAPVLQQTKNNQWTVRFVMPAEYTLETLPIPIDERIKINESKIITYVTITFSGMSSKSNLDEHVQKLKDFVAKNHLKVRGEPIYAFYNPPWTLPFLRRNEIWIEIE